MRRVCCNEMRKRGGKDIGSVTHGAATFVYEFQFLQQNQNQNQNQLQWEMVHNNVTVVVMEQTLHS